MNPEDAVIDAIDQLVDEQLAGGPVDDYSVDRYDRCRHCRQGWHGLPNDVGCPGAHARGYQIREWKRKLRTQPGYVKPRWDYVAEIERQTAAIRERVDREMLTGVFHCPYCNVSVQRGLQCNCPPSRTARFVNDRIATRQPPSDPGTSSRSALNEIWGIDSRPRRCVRCSRTLGMLHTYTSMDGTTPLCRDCFYYRVENSAQPWIPEAEAWADQERRG